MTLLISFFGVSLLIVVSMIVYRTYELSYNKEFISNNKRELLDKKLLTFYEKNISLLSKHLNALGLKVKKLPEITNHKLHDLWQVVSKKIDSRFEKIRNSKSKHEKGSVSVYWQSVSEGRNGGVDSGKKE